MKRLLSLIAVLPFILFAEETFSAHLTGDPYCNKELPVSTFSGEFFNEEIDHIVPGVEPIILRRYNQTNQAIMTEPISTPMCTIVLSTVLIFGV